MSANIVKAAGHVLLPHQADWLEEPAITRSWRCAIATALAGDEARSSTRGNAWRRLSYAVLPWDHVERARFEERSQAALREAAVAVPHWGRGAGLRVQADVGDTTLVLERADHGIVDGEYLLVQPTEPSYYDTWDLCVCVGSVGALVSLSASLNNSYPSGTRCWPLLFGLPEFDDLKALNATRARFGVSVLNDRRQINPTADDGFEDYALGAVGTLAGGEGWIGNWTVGQFA